MLLMQLLPPAVNASRLKLLDLATRVEARRLKLKSVLHAYPKATHVAADPTWFLENDVPGEAQVRTQRTRQTGPTLILVEWSGSSGRVE